jgi:hypothetical protein
MNLGDSNPPRGTARSTQWVAANHHCGGGNGANFRIFLGSLDFIRHLVAVQLGETDMLEELRYRDREQVYGAQPLSRRPAKPVVYDQLPQPVSALPLTHHHRPQKSVVSMHIDASGADDAAL